MALLPKIIVLFSNYRCNAQCIMCSAWQKQLSGGELSLDHIEKIFSDRLLKKSLEVVNLTGGEPTLRPELIDIVKILIDHCVHLKRIDIPTNGINTGQVVDKIERILPLLLSTPVKLSVTISLDGIGDIHEAVRGVPGAFAKIEATIEELKDVMSFYPAFSLSFNTTINKLNYADLDNILNYSLKKRLGFNFTPAACSEIGVESLAIKNDFLLADREKKEVAIFVEGLLETKQVDILYGNFLLHWLKTGRRSVQRCAFREGRAILCEPDGTIYSCGNFKCFKLGNLLEVPLGHILGLGNNFKKEYIKKCETCNSNCYF